MVLWTIRKWSSGSWILSLISHNLKAILQQCRACWCVLLSALALLPPHRTGRPTTWMQTSHTWVQLWQPNTMPIPCLIGPSMQTPQIPHSHPSNMEHQVIAHLTTTGTVTLTPQLRKPWTTRSTIPIREHIVRYPLALGALLRTWRPPLTVTASAIPASSSTSRKYTVVLQPQTASLVWLQYLAANLSVLVSSSWSLLYLHFWRT